MYQAQELVVVQKSFSQGPLGKLCKPPSHRIVASGGTPRDRKYLKKLGDEVSNPRTGQKKYWRALKKLINKSTATIIPPILHNGSFVTNFKEKCSIFNEYFKNQCTLVATSSVLPPLEITTDLRLNKVNFTEKDIVGHIRNLNINKANGHDNISARILKICDDSIALPLFLIYKKCLDERIFPRKWKKANLIPIHKKMKII